MYTIGSAYAHAEARKSPTLDGKVVRDSKGKVRLLHILLLLMMIVMIMLLMHRRSDVRSHYRGMRRMWHAKS